MAQRRYTHDEINQAIASGERAPDTSGWFTTQFKDYIPDAIEPYAQGLERLDRNILAGAANAPATLLQAPELVKNLYNATSDSLRGDNWVDAFARSSVGGEQGQQVLNDYMERAKAEYLAQASDEERNDPAINSRLEAAIAGTEGYNRLRESQTGTPNQWSLTAQDYVRDKLSLQPTYAMTSQDEIGDFIGGAIVPTPGKISKVIDALPALARYPARVAEWFVPGSTGPANAVANAVVPTVAGQGIRYLADAPSIPAGTAGLAEELQSGQPLAVEDASAPDPFVTAATTPQQGLIDLGFQVNIPDATAPTSTRVQRPVNPDRDEHGGGGASPWAWVAGIAGAATVVGAALRGKVTPGILGKVVQDVDSPAARVRMEPTATDHIQLEKSLTKTQKVVTGLQKTRALDSVTENELRKAGWSDAAIEDAVTKINREVASASPLEIQQATKRTQMTGELPLLNRKTIPTSHIRLMHDTQMDAAQQELFQKAAVYGDRMDTFTLETDSLNNQINDKYLRLRNVRDPATQASITADIHRLEAQVIARSQPGHRFDGNLSVQEVRQLLRQADIDPKVKAALTGIRKVVDDFREVGVSSGLWTRAHADEFKRTRPNFIPVSHDPNAGEGALSRIKEAGRGKSEPRPYSHDMFNSHRTTARTNSQSDMKPVGKLSNVIDSLDTMIHEFHRQHRSHRAAQTFFETLAQTSQWGKAAQVAHPPMSVKDFESLGPTSRIGQLLQEPNVVTYNANGKMHFMRTADSETARAIRNNPSSTMAVADLIRRNVQKTYTGNAWAPLFAPVAAENELGVVRAKLSKDYSKGYLDQLFKRVFPEGSFLSQTFDFVPDPTIRLQQAAAVAELVSNAAINRVGEALGNHLMSQSTFMRQLGYQQANAVAVAGVRAMSDVRSRIQFFQEHNILDMQHLVEHNEGIFQDYKSMQRMLTKRGPVSRTTKAVFNMYTDVADAVRNSVKYAIASQNLDNLIRKHGGFDNIPNDVMRKYIRDMRYMSGDMTRAIGNETLSKGLSVVPYGQHVVNGTMHMLEGMTDKGVKGGMYTMSRIITNVVVPKVLMVGLLTQWMRDDDGKSEFEDHWWSNMPHWQRMQSVPVLSPQFLYDWATGSKKSPTMGDVIFMRQAPEAIPFAEVVSSMVQATGLYGVKADKTQTWWDIWHGIASVGNVNIPLVDTWNKLSADDDIPTNLGGDSDTARKIGVAFGAMFGMAVDIIGTAYKASSNSLDRNQGIPAALERGFQTAIETAKQKLPETHLSPLFGGQRRHYTKSQVRDRNQSKFSKIKDISQTRTDMKQDTTADEDDFTMPATNDPKAQDIMRELHTTANARTMKALRTNRSKLYNQLERLDANRGHEKLSPSEYTRRSEQLKMAIHDIDRHEEETFERMENRLAAMYKDIGVTDVDSAIDYVKQTMHP